MENAEPQPGEGAPIKPEVEQFALKSGQNYQVRSVGISFQSYRNCLVEVTACKGCAMKQVQIFLFYYVKWKAEQLFF